MRDLLQQQLPSKGCTVLPGMCHVDTTECLSCKHMSQKCDYGVDYPRRGRGGSTTEKKPGPSLVHPRSPAKQEVGVHTEKILFLCFQFLCVQISSLAFPRPLQDIHLLPLLPLPTPAESSQATPGVKRNVHSSLIASDRRPQYPTGLCPIITCSVFKLQLFRQVCLLHRAHLDSEFLSESMRIFLLISVFQSGSRYLSKESQIIYVKDLCCIYKKREQEAYRAIGEGSLLMSLMQRVCLPEQCNTMWKRLR